MPGLGLPNKVVGLYWTGWNPGTSLVSVPTSYNVIYPFAAHPSGTTGAVSWSYGVLNKTHIDTCRGRGQRIVMSCGGAGGGISFSSRTKSQAFVNSIVAINSSLGGTNASPKIDGVDFNTFEAEAAPNTAEYLWMFAELKRLFGANFIITSPPAPWKQVDKDMIKTALAQGLMDYAAPQYYDGPGLQEPAYITKSVGEWIAGVAGGNAAKIVVGFGLGTGNYSTIAQITSAYKTIKAATPAIKGAFLWQHVLDADAGWPFANQLAPLVGATASTTTPTPTPTPTPTTGKKVTIGASSYPLSGTNIERLTDALVVYTTGGTTTTNIYGAEATVSGGKVTAIADRQTTSGGGIAIPSGGYVLSGHGTARSWLLTNAKVGATVSGDVPASSTPANDYTATVLNVVTKHNDLVAALQAKGII